MTFPVFQPFPTFNDADGFPLEAGYLYLGTPNLNPETNPVSVYWDSAATQPAAQPIRTTGGYPSRNGTPAIIYATGDFSLTVRDKKGSLVFTAPTSTSLQFINGALAASNGASLINFLQTGPHAVARSVASKLQEYKSVKDAGAVLDGVTDDTVAIQNALNDYPYVSIPGSALCGGLTVPASNKGLYVEGDLLANANNVTVIQFLTDVTRDHIKTVKRLSVKGNGKTGVTGMMFGSLTNNPSAGAWESVLYVTGEDIYASGCETGMWHAVTMEHDFKQVVLYNNTVGLKMYSDPVNGGCNANRFASLRLQQNGVGAIIKNRVAAYGFPLENNYFGSLILQGNSICGIAFIGANSQQIDNVHIESNGLGAASINIDGYTIPKCDMLVVHGTVYVNDTDHASASSLANGSILVQDYGRFISNGLTGFGSNTIKVTCDATSTYHEMGTTNAIGYSNKLASYGTLVAATGLGITSGAPTCRIGRGRNMYNGANPMLPDISNLIGTTSSQYVKSEFGLTPEVTFAASAGSTASNRLFMNMLTGAVGEFQISSLLVKPSANCSFEARWLAGAAQTSAVIALTGGVWQRITFVTYGQANHQLYFFPSDATGASVQFQAVQCLSGPLEQVSDIYQHGTVNVSTELYNRNNAAPVAGTWAVGDVVYNSAPAAAGTIGWVCTTAGTPGTWKTFGAIAA